MTIGKVENLIVDTSAFIKNASLQNFGENIHTIQEVVDEITNKRQLRRLVVLPYDLVIKDVFPENIKFIIDFSKKTGDYPSLSATDIKVLALTYQMEKEKVGTDHLNTVPQIDKVISMTSRPTDMDEGVEGFYFPKKKFRNNEEISSENGNEETGNVDSDEVSQEEIEKIVQELNNSNNDDEKNTNETNEVSQEEIEKIVEDLNNVQCNDIESEKLDKILAPIEDSVCPCLSANDIKVIALTYQMEKEKVGTDHLNAAPQIDKVISMTSRPTDMEDDDEVSQEEIEKIIEDLNNVECNDIESEKLDNILAPVKDSENLDDNDGEEDDESDEDNDGGWVTSKNFTKNKGESDIESENLDEILAPIKDSENLDDNTDEEEGRESDEDDDGGWITPKNIHNVKKVNFKTEDNKPIVVACITSDFAMQNVLKQLGMNVISEDGTMIRNLRTFILRCYACFKTTSLMTKIFCPYCGNKTLKKVAYSLNENGTQVVHINPRKRINIRGKKFSMPKPQGGKHAMNPHLYEDQKFPQQLVSKMARMKNDPMNSDYIAGFSPFMMRDTVSKSATLGLHRHETKYWMRRNPNEVVKRGKKKK